MAEKKQDKPVTTTLATGTKVTAPQEVIDKVNRKSGGSTAASKTSSK